MAQFVALQLFLGWWGGMAIEWAVVQHNNKKWLQRSLLWKPSPCVSNLCSSPTWCKVDSWPTSSLILHSLNIQIHPILTNNPYLVTFLIKILIFECYAVWCGFQNGYQKDTITREIELFAHNMIIILSSIVNMIFIFFGGWGGQLHGHLMAMRIFVLEWITYAHELQKLWYNINQSRGWVPFPIGGTLVLSPRIQISYSPKTWSSRRIEI